ncbi:YigZ family protein [bacterium]|nr:YigZ family protein [bacterium]
MEDFLYKTAANTAIAAIEEKRSRFIATVSRSNSREDFKTQLAKIKSKHASATHNCWAFRIGFSPVEELSSDDGEPSGSAGLPILRVLTGNELTNVICVVTRYYGGIKLGIGGLIRAYSQATAAALREIKIIEIHERLEFAVELPYNIFSDFKAILARNDGKLIEANFAVSVKLRFDIPKSRESSIKNALADISAGKIIPNLIKKTSNQDATDKM